MRDPERTEDPDEFALVIQALRDGLGNCVVWHEKGARLVREDKELAGLTPAFIRREVIAFVRSQAEPFSVMKQIPETREEWRSRYRFYYKVVLPVEGYALGLFVEMRSTDEDREFPCVTIVRAHVQRK